MGIFEKLLYFSIITVANPKKKSYEGHKKFQRHCSTMVKELTFILDANGSSPIRNIFFSNFQGGASPSPR